MTGSVELLAQYPEWVGERLCSVTTGLPAKHDFMPAIKSLREACEAEFSTTRFAMQWEANAAQQRLPAPQVIRPTLQQMHEKYGENWGLVERHEESDRIKSNRKAILDKANTAILERECREAGIPNTGVSPALWKRIRGET